VVATPHPNAFWGAHVLAPGAWALLLLFAVFGWTFSVAVIKTVAAKAAPTTFFLSAAAALLVPRTVDAVASASVVVPGTSLRPTRHVGVPAVVASLVELVLAAVAVGLPLPGVKYFFGLFKTLKWATADVLANVLDKPLL